MENIVYEAEELFALYIKKLASFSEPSGKSGTAGLPGDHKWKPCQENLTELFGKVAEDLGLGRSQ